MKYLLALILALTVLPHIVVAQDDDDKGFLTRAIEGALSGAGREVNIEGFEGALSSEASFEKMTIADDQGVWLTLDQVTLIWSRAALLRGRLEVQELRAVRLDIPRLPDPADEPAEIPSAEAQGFEMPKLPELPVSVNIETMAIEQLILGEPIIGAAATMSLTATARLNDEGLDARFDATRTDGQQGQFGLGAKFARESEVLELDLVLDEAPGGLVALLAKLPDQPSVSLEVKGAGPLHDFAADIDFSTDDVQRIAGRVTSQGALPGETGDTTLTADIGGDIAPLVAPEYTDFFGNDIGLRADATLLEDGMIALNTFDLRARVLELSGNAMLNQDRWPVQIDVTGRMASPDGTPIALPGANGATIETATLKVDYDAAEGEVFLADIVVADIITEQLRIETTRLNADGTLQGNLNSVGQFLADLTVEAQGLDLEMAEAAQAMGRDLTLATNINYIEGQPVRLSDLSVKGAGIDIAGWAIVASPTGDVPTRFDLDVDVAELQRFSGLAQRELGGAAKATARGSVSPLDGRFDVAVQGDLQDLLVGIEQADALLGGQTQLNARARRDETGTFVDGLRIDNQAISVQADAAIRTGDSTVNATASLTDAALVFPGYPGAFDATLEATEDAQGWASDLNVTGPGIDVSGWANVAAPVSELATTFSLDFDVAGLERFSELAQRALGGAIQLNAQGSATPKNGFFDVDLTGDTTDLAVGIEQADTLLAGVTKLNLRAKQDETGLFVEGLNVENAALSVQADADVRDGTGTVRAQAQLNDTSIFVPQFSGATQATVDASQDGNGWTVDARIDAPQGTKVSFSGLATGPDAALDFIASLADVSIFVPEVSGPLSVEGRAERAAAGWNISTNATGPSGMTAEVSGLAADDGTLNMVANGVVPLGLAQPFVKPRSLAGRARFDLRIDGPPEVSSVSGEITTDDVVFNDPNARIGLENVKTAVRFSGGQANVAVGANVVTGGRLEVNGDVNLLNAPAADLDVRLNEVVIIDPRLFETRLDGAISIVGPLTPGPSISGQINIGETEVRVPASGITSIGDIPMITHVGSSRVATVTRDRAGLIVDPEEEARAASSGPGLPLDLRINAPGRIFVRGRGLNAELGGGLTLTGSTSRIISAGSFDLIRGHLDILGKRFDLVEGSTQFQGDLVPYIRFVTETSTDAGTASIIVQGPADEPEVLFESDPEAPQDEVLAQILFGTDISNISALQALELANAVATLAGRGGDGVIGRLRNGFGLDNLDLTTTDDGQTAVRVGKYLTDNVYTDFTAAADGTSEVNLNLDVTDSFKATAGYESDGNSSLGLFFERDY